jgi:subfamily B ATP-binding cassette protein MsbA
LSALARLFGLLRPYRLRLAAAIVCMVVYSITSTLWIALIQPFMAVLFKGSTAPASPLAAKGWLAAVQGRATAWLAASTPLESFERLCALILVLFLVRNIADYTASYLSVSVEQAATRDLRRRLFAHLQALPMAWLHQRRGGEILSRLTNDVEALRGSLAAGISNLLKDGLTLLGCVVWVFAASWKLALFWRPGRHCRRAVAISARCAGPAPRRRMAEPTGIVQWNKIAAAASSAAAPNGQRSAVRRWGTVAPGRSPAALVSVA